MPSPERVLEQQEQRLNLLIALYDMCDEGADWPAWPEVAERAEPPPPMPKHSSSRHPCSRMA
jgi:hypothetical protein